MTMPTTNVSIAGAKAEFPSINSNLLNAYYNCDRFNGGVPVSGTISLGDLRGKDGRTAMISAGRSQYLDSNYIKRAPDRYGWGLANCTGFYHAEAGVNTAAFGSIDRYIGLLGNNFCGLALHKPHEPFSNQDTDIHLEVFTKSSSNSGWTTLDIITNASKAYGNNAISYSFSRTSAAAFGPVTGTSPTTYAWTFVQGSNTLWDQAVSKNSNQDSDVSSLFNTVKNYADTGSWTAIIFIRFS